MTNAEILTIAMRQSAVDSNCAPEDFLSFQNKTVISASHPEARKYLSLPFICDLTSYGNNIVASVSAELSETVTEYINTYSIEHCFETPNLHILMNKLKDFDCNICFMAEYFLPDAEILKPLPCAYELKLLTPPDFADYYTPQWSNALCKKRKQLDMLAIGAYDGNQCIGLAGASADCDSMWQIGIDVLPPYRRQGVASALTSALAAKILELGKVPFYCCAWSNIKSARNAIHSGFRPAWVQVTARENGFIADLNK